MFKIRRMGCNGIHDRNFHIDRKNGYDCYLLLFIKSPAVFCINGEEHYVQNGTFIIFNQCSPHNYRAADTEYVDDWIQVESDDINIPGISIIFDKPIFIGEAINIPSYFKLIYDSFLSFGNNIETENLITAMLSQLFYDDGKASFINSTPYFRELLNLRKNIYNHPEKNWNIQDMSNELYISDSYLYALYKKQFGTTCMNDVINRRLELAKQYLTDKSMSIESIAYKCGYQSVIHFSRQFCKYVGMPPGKWRKIQD